MHLCIWNLDLRICEIIDRGYRFVKNFSKIRKMDFEMKKAEIQTI